jgi:hypothetical protein
MTFSKLRLTKGYQVDTTDSEAMRQIRILEKKKVISTQQKKSIRCKNCGNTIVIPTDAYQDDPLPCISCGKKTIFREDISNKFLEITSINFDAVKSLIDTYIKQELGQHNFTFDSDRRLWYCHIDGKKVPVCVGGWSSYNLLFRTESERCWMYISLQYDIDKNKVSFLSTQNIIDLVELVDTNGRLLQGVFQVAQDYPQLSIFDREAEFDSFVNDVSYNDFEKVIVSFFNKLKGKSNQIERFLSFLSKYQDTFINAKYAHIGGPSQPDFISLNLKAYLESGLKLGISGEAKKYIKGKVSLGDYMEALTHAQQEGNRFIIVASTNSVAATVWKYVYDSFQEDQYRQVIFDKDILLLLSAVTGIDITKLLN